MDSNTYEKCKELEENILNHVGITKDYSIKECYIDENERYISYIELNKVKKNSGKVLLMTHGYLGSKIGFFKMYKQLMEHYYIISFDLMGQGISSSENDLQLNSTEDWINYFIEDIDKFVKKLELEKFHILGHSLGAYILTHYADKYPHRVNKMCLLSPGGVNRQNPEFQRKFKEFIDNQGWGTKYFLNLLYEKIFKKKYSPLTIWNLPKWVKRIIASIVYRGKRLSLDKKEQDYFVELYKEIYANEGSSNRCIGYLFDNGPMSNNPLMNIFKKLHSKKSIHLFYGDFDWMDFVRVEKNLRNEGLNISVENVTNCEHQILFQNPYLASKMVLSRLQK